MQEKRFVAPDRALPSLQLTLVWTRVRRIANYHGPCFIGPPRAPWLAIQVRPTLPDHRPLPTAFRPVRPRPVAPEGALTALDRVRLRPTVPYRGQASPSVPSVSMSNRAWWRPIAPDRFPLPGWKRFTGHN